MPSLRTFACLTSAIVLLGCATTRIVHVREDPPVELMQECTPPAYDKTTVGGIVRGLQAYHGALEQCNLDKAGLRAWAEDPP